MSWWKSEQKAAVYPRSIKRYFELQDASIPVEKETNYGRYVKERFASMFKDRPYRYVRDPVRSPLPIDVVVFMPTPEEPIYVLHTVGISDVALALQAETERTETLKFTEICMLLPANWPFPEGEWEIDADYAWPIWLAMELGHFFHSHLGWILYSTALSNSESEDSFSVRNRFSGIMLAQFQGSLGEIKMPDGNKVDIFIPILLYPEEIALMDTHGAEWVADQVLMANHNSFIINENRKSIGKIQKEEPR